MNKNTVRLVEGYFESCSTLNSDRLFKLLSPDVVHYRPMGVIIGAQEFWDHVLRDVEENGSSWHPETLTASVEGNRAVAEWTSLKPGSERVLRGCSCFELYEPDRISEVRVYLSARPDSSAKLNELGGFPYRERGWRGFWASWC